MDETGAWLTAIIEWVSGLAVSPIHYAGKGSSFGNRPAQFIELFYLTQGDITELVMGPMRTRFAQGQLGLVNVHFGNITADAPRFDSCCVFLDVTGVKRFDVLGKAPLALASQVRDGDRVLRAFTGLIERCRQSGWTLQHYFPTSRRGPSPRGSDLATQTLLKAGLLELLGTLLEEATLDAGGGPSIALPASLGEAMAMIHRQYHQPWLTRDELAMAAGVHPDHLNRLFRRHVGVPPMRYLMQVRVAQANFLLTHTRHRIGDIARQVGFDDAFHFSRVFRQHMGAGPRDHRRQARGYSD